MTVTYDESRQQTRRDGMVIGRRSDMELDSVLYAALKANLHEVLEVRSAN